MSRLDRFANRAFLVDAIDDRLENMLEPMDIYDSEIDEEDDEDEEEDDEE